MAAPRALLAESRGQDIADEEDGPDADVNPHPRAGTHLSASRARRGYSSIFAVSPRARRAGRGPSSHGGDDRRRAGGCHSARAFDMAQCSALPCPLNTCSGFVHLQLVLLTNHNVHQVSPEIGFFASAARRLKSYLGDPAAAANRSLGDDEQVA